MSTTICAAGDHCHKTNLMLMMWAACLDQHTNPVPLCLGFFVRLLRTP
jgi:hypothetical protein